MPQDMINKIMIEENIFPRWEHNIPTLGTKHSHAGNKTRLRLVVTLLLMMVVGVNGVKAQTVDYSGTYFIAYYGFGSGYYNDSNPANNYYWCPVECKTGTWEGWFDFYPDDDTDNDTKTDTYSKTDTKMDFLTTHKCRDGVYESRNAQWIITKHETLDAYYIQHKKSSKYLTMNGSMMNAGSTNRLRVHLQEDIAPNNKSLFEIVKHEVKTYGTSYVIKPYSQNQYINVSGLSTNSNTGNYDELYGTNGKTDGPKGLPNVGGTLGWYSDINDKNGQWFLEDYIKRPTIGYDASGNIVITNNDASTTVYYTKGGGDPKTSGTALSETTETLTSFTDGTVIKAVAKVGDEYSNVVTFTAVVHVGISNQYLIQNLERTDFYMIPGDVSNNNTYVNTTSLFRPTMSWYFSDAGSSDGIQYYYIINGSTGDYLYFTSNNVYMKTSSDFDVSDSYKFAIVQGFDADSNPDGFHIVPKAQISDNTYCIYKGGWADTTPPTIANSKADAVKGSTNARRPEQEHTRWNFVQPNTLNKTAPFKITDASTHITKFYKIASVGSSGYYIVPPTGNNTNATTSNSADAAVVKSGTWYFEVAQEPILTHEDPTKIDWCTYYYIRNAETGKYLYFIRDANNAGACLEMRSTIESGQEDRYMFTWAKTAATVANYYIVPKKLKDASQNNISSLRKNDNNTNIVTNITRGAGNFAWTFEDADLFCSNPVFEESGDNIVISCILGSAEIHYTTNGDDPSASYLVYPPTKPFSKSEQHLIRACAVINDGATPTPNTASSDVITFIKNPDITFTEGNEFPYAGGSAVEPTVSSVTITPEGGSAITIDATEYSVAFSNNTEVGEAIVTISDALPENNTIISGSSHFTITPKSLGNGTTAADGIDIIIAKTGENEYSLTVTYGAITLTPYNSADQTAPYDYTVTGTSDESGYVAIVEAKKDGDEYTGNYSGGAIAVYVKANFPTLTSETDGGSAAAYQATRDLAAPSDLKSCIVTAVDYNAGTVEVQELAYIPVGVPVLLLTEDDAPHNADFTATVYTVGEGGAADVSANKLCKSDGSVAADWGQYYIFTKGEFVLSMGDNKTIKEGKYYFENEKYVSGSSPAPSKLRIARGGTTGIDNSKFSILNSQLSGIWFTLNGQKLNKKPTRKGIYMHNGKKVVIK